MWALPQSDYPRIGYIEHAADFTPFCILPTNVSTFNHQSSHQCLKISPEKNPNKQKKENQRY